MKVYCVQHDIVWENKSATIARVDALLAASRPERGSLILLAEMFSTGFSLNVPGIREGAERETEKFLAATARQWKAHVMGGVVTANRQGRGANQSVVFNPQGREVARYTKLQPFAPGGEAKQYGAGRAPITFPLRGFTVAPFICYDLRFPEHFRVAAKQGAQLYTVISSWPVARIQHWVTLLQARAIENQAYVAGVNRIGTDPHLTYTGRSLIVGPGGEILADAGGAETVICAELDLRALKAYRKKLPFLADMR